MKRRSQGEGRSQKERGGAKNWWRWIGGAGGAAAFTVHLEMFNSIHFRLISLDLIGFNWISLYFFVFHCISDWAICFRFNGSSGFKSSVI